ncbi:MAG: hypothetical protein Q9208_007556 [Pyrenodesmia sp. 3 TL-2023]
MATNREERFLERQRGAGARDINLAFDLELPGITRVSKTPLKPQKSGRSKKTPQPETLPPRSTRKTPNSTRNVPALQAGRTPATARRRTTKAKTTAGTGSEVEAVAPGQASEAVERSTGGASTKKRKALDEIPETEAASSPKKRRKRKSIGQQTLKKKPRAPLKPNTTTEPSNTPLPVEETEDVDTKNAETAAEEPDATGEDLAKPGRLTGVAKRAARRTQTTQKPPGQKLKPSLRTQRSKTKPPATRQETFEADEEIARSVHEPAKIESPTELTAPAETDSKPKPRKRKRKAIVQSPRKRKKPTRREPALGYGEIEEEAMAESQEGPAIIPTAAVALSVAKTNKRGRKPKSIPCGHAEPFGELLDTSQTNAKAEPVRLQESQPDNELAAINQITAATVVDKKGRKKGRKPKLVREQQAVPSEELINPCSTFAEAEPAQTEQYRPENEQPAISSAKTAAPLGRKGSKRGRKSKSALEQQPEPSEETTGPSPTAAEADPTQIEQLQQESRLSATDPTGGAVSVESKGKKRGRKPKSIPNEKPYPPDELVDPSSAPVEAEPAQTEQSEAEKEPSQPVEDAVSPKRKGRKRKSIGQAQRPRKKAMVKTAPDGQSDKEITHPDIKPIDTSAGATMAPAPKRKGRPKKPPVTLQQNEDVAVERAMPERSQPAVTSKRRGRPKQPVSTAGEAKPEDTTQQPAESLDPEIPLVKKPRKKMVEPIPPNEPGLPVEKPYAPTAVLEPEPHLSPSVKKRGRPKKQAPTNSPPAGVLTRIAISDPPKAQPRCRAPKAPPMATTQAPVSAPDPATTPLDPVHSIEECDDPLSDHASSRPPRSKPKPKKSKSTAITTKPHAPSSRLLPDTKATTSSNRPTATAKDDITSDRTQHPARNNNPPHIRHPPPPSTDDPSENPIPPSTAAEADIQARLASLSASVKKRKAEMGARMINAPPPPPSTSAPASRAVAAKPQRGGLEGFVFSRVKAKRRKVLGAEEEEAGGRRSDEGDELDPGLQALLSRVKGVGGGGVVRTF